MENAVMLGTGRHHQHVRRTHVERPVGDTIFRPSSIPTMSLSSVATRWARTPTENEPTLSEKSPMPTWLREPRVSRGPVASPRHGSRELLREGLRSCAGCICLPRSAEAWLAIPVVWNLRGPDLSCSVQIGTNCTSQQRRVALASLHLRHVGRERRSRSVYAREVCASKWVQLIPGHSDGIPVGFDQVASNQEKWNVPC